MSTVPVAERNKVYGARYRARHPEARKASQDRYYLANLEKERERSRLYYATHREQEAVRSRRYREEHGEVINARVAEWRKANPDKHRANQTRRRARRRNAVVEPYDRDAIYDRDGGRCHICHAKVPRRLMTIDHLIPIVHGGSDTPDNVAVAHRACNLRRGPGRLPAQLRLTG
jgi:5-methylcytosine-specific restriction endonuclease McrA